METRPTPPPDPPRHAKTRCYLRHQRDCTLPTDPDGVDDLKLRNGSEGAAEYYQLTHDYLVPSIREWVDRKKHETRRGRAELMLKQRAAAWAAKPESHQLLSLGE